jgi:hypothetical protein
MKGTYTWCRTCKHIDNKGYRGKRCKWCNSLLVINPLDKLIIENKIKVSFNNIGMPIFTCNHVKGYDKGKGKNICERCKLRLSNKILFAIQEHSEGASK